MQAREDAQGAVVAIGNFDGMHRGHQSLIARAGHIARDSGRKLAVLTFEPHPAQLFRPDEPPFRITPYNTKLRLLEQAGIDILYAIPFDWDFASQPAEDFIARVLKQGLAPAHIVVGSDFRFGQLRRGTPDMLRAHGLEVTVIEEVSDESGGKISSSNIRTALRQGKIAEANEMLGWDWEIEGEVVRGDRRGRELGFPTANVALGDTLHPAYGIYAARVRIADDGPDAPWLPAVTNIGIRPMFEVPVAQVESFIFDFDRDIYGRALRMRPVRWLRGEAKFSSLDELKTQIARDCEEARKF